MAFTHTQGQTETFHTDLLENALAGSAPAEGKQVLEKVMFDKWR